MARLDETTRAFLDHQRVAHLATASKDGTPHVIPICFARVDDHLYVAIDEKPKRRAPTELKRVTNILENERVAIVADVYDEDWSRLAFVLVSGRARLLQDGPTYVQALGALRAKYAQYRAMALEGRPLIAVEAERVTRWGTARADGAGP
jgi:PPOX class probable F420-dependent enzyme